MTHASPLVQMSHVLEAQDEADLVQRLRVAASSIGFDTVLQGVEIRRPLLEPIQHIISTYPLTWQKTYQERQYIQVDPTVQHCQSQLVPLVWSENLYTPESVEMWEESRSFGLGFGVSIPVRESAQVTSMISLARDKPLDPDGEPMDLVLAQAKVLASCAHFALARIVVPGLLASKTPKLSPRETECLNWAAQGKTSWEIGQILHIAEPTAVFHINNVVRKLGVGNRNQAIAVGVALGLVH